MPLSVVWAFLLYFFCKQKTAFQLRISDWSSDVCSSDLAVAEVEQRADVPRLALVGGDDARLGRNTMGNRPMPGFAVAGEQRGAVRLAPGEKDGIVDQAVFDHLGIARAQFARRQGGERRRVDQDDRRLVKGADQILAGGDVDRSLAADAAVDLREQGRRNLDGGAAALDGGARTAGEVADTRSG